jgi:hypothetical protein
VLGVGIVFDLACTTAASRDHNPKPFGVDDLTAVVAEAVRTGAQFIQCSPEVPDRLALLESEVRGWFRLPRPLYGIPVKFGHDFGLDRFKIEHGWLQFGVYL